jgi:hypothetical protein
MLLGEMLVAQGVATTAEVATALRRQRADGGHLGAHLISMGVLTALQLYALLKEQSSARTTIPFCQRMLARWEAEFGVDHPSTSEMRCKLARALMADGRYDEALAASQTAYDCFRVMFGSKHNRTIDAELVRDAAKEAARGPATASILRLRAMTRESQAV